MATLGKIALAGGCFWGTQRYFQLLPGVKNTTVGYANGGSDKAPSYEEVKHGSGHAETVLVEFDSNQITLEELIKLYFTIVDPFSLNKQGHDVGIQYRTGIYYFNEDQHTIIDRLLSEWENKLGQKTVIEVLPLSQFFDAETYHQDYLIKNPNGYCHLPKERFEEARNYGKE